MSGTVDSTSIDVAMRRALEIARLGPVSANPRVGAVVLDVEGQVVGEGWHDGAGTPHAEVVALRAAGPRARGGTAVVTLEPCSHTGRTGPCTLALVEAGVARVVYGRPDSTQTARGGSRVLSGLGLQTWLVTSPALRAEADALVAAWQQAVDLGRPLVTWKLATTLDGRSAAADGSSRWITGEAARADVHRLRGEADTVLVGTGTVLADDPRLTVRDAAGSPAARQPLRAVMGLRPLPAAAHVTDHEAPSLLLTTRDPAAALADLWASGRRQVWLEGGPTLAAAFWRAGLVDRLIAYVAPALLGSGRPAVADLGITSIDGVVRLQLDDVTRVGDDVRLTLRPQPASTAAPSQSEGTT
jgi:diaminohydroxyphosphoribosylaminopyrimidine deaminase/5-amino-6-(5-phosphoribosylamino)uracil reductase